MWNSLLNELHKVEDFSYTDTKLYRQIVGIPMGANCAPLVADLFYSAMKEIS